MKSTGVKSISPNLGKRVVTKKDTKDKSKQMNCHNLIKSHNSPNREKKNESSSNPKTNKPIFPEKKPSFSTYSILNLQPFKYNTSQNFHENQIHDLAELEKSDKEFKEFQDNSTKLKELIHNYSNVKKNLTISTNSLNKIRSVLLTWLKGENENENVEYSSFLTEKKIRYLLKNKEKMELRVKNLDNEITQIKKRLIELKSELTEIYVHYEFDELKKDIERFEQSPEIKNKTNTRMVEKLEEMKRLLPLVKEYNVLKEQDEQKTNEKAEIIKICKGSIQTLNILSNYYKNLKKKSNDTEINKKDNEDTENVNKIEMNDLKGKSPKKAQIKQTKTEVIPKKKELKDSVKKNERKLNTNLKSNQK